MKKLALFIFLITFSNSFSQKITGVVLDSETKEPIEKAHVFLQNKVVITNSKGVFSFYHKKGNKRELKVTHLNYINKDVTFLKSDKKLTIYIDVKQEVLDEIFLINERTLQDKIKYKKLANLPKSIHSFASVTKGDSLFVFGGDTSKLLDENKRGISELIIGDEAEIMRLLTKPKLSNFHSFIGDLQLYNFSSKTWQITKNKFRKKAYQNAVIYKNNIYLIGGKRLSRTKSRELLEDKVEVFNVNSNNVILDGTNPHQAVNAEAILYENKVIVIGGSTKIKKNGKKEYSNKIHFYDLESGLWYMLAEMPKGKETKGIVVEDILYLFGGFREKKLTDIESFNFNTFRWKKEGNLFSGLENPAITYANNTIYIFENSHLLTLDVNTKELKEYHIDLTLLGSRMHFYDNKLYILGGYFDKQFEKTPQKGFYSIDLSEFELTKIGKQKKLLN